MIEQDNNISEEEFLASYDLKDYPGVGVTVDLLVFTIRDGRLSLLLIKRGGHPEKGKWGLPGGFVNTTESLDDAASRELSEETGLELHSHLEQLRTYGYPGRDKRGFIVSVAYVALVPNAEDPTAGDDANDARFFDVEDILDGDESEEGFDLAFDHRDIIVDGLERVRAKIEYSPIAHKFLSSQTFTIPELRRIYEIIWGQTLNPSNFRRKMLSVPNLLESVEQNRTGGMGRPSHLYRAGEATDIFPPLQRDHLE